MVKIKFPDGNVKEFESAVTGMDIAKSISHKLAKEVLSISVNGVTWDLMRGITTDPRLSYIHGTMKRDAMLSGTHLHTLWQKLFAGYLPEYQVRYRSGY